MRMWHPLAGGSFNRTTVECKSFWMMGHIVAAARFNRTTVECKFERASINFPLLS